MWLIWCFGIEWVEARQSKFWPHAFVCSISYFVKLFELMVWIESSWSLHNTNGHNFDLMKSKFLTFLRWWWCSWPDHFHHFTFSSIHRVLLLAGGLWVATTKKPCIPCDLIWLFQIHMLPHQWWILSENGKGLSEIFSIILLLSDLCRLVGLKPGILGYKEIVEHVSIP